MKKVIPFIFLMFLLFGCNNEEQSPSQGLDVPLQVSAQLIKLSDDAGSLAGQLEIISNAPEINVKWNTDPCCNLDTTQTVIKVKGGKATLPIKWISKQEKGTYGPEGLAFKAGVQIEAGSNSQYIPLVWAEKIDSTKVLENLQTRAAGDVMPRVIQITLTPSTVNMNDANGGSMYVNMIDAPYVILGLSELTTDLNIDMTKIPNHILAPQMLDFKWTAAGAPKFNFKATIFFQTEGLTVEGIVNYTSSGGGEQPGVTLNYVNSTLPTGNISQTGGSYTFNFEGTYTGGLQARAIADGVVIATGTNVVNKQPSVLVPQNELTTNRNITFQYKRDDSNWIDFPTTTNRIQEGGTGGGVNTLNYVNSTLPAGNIPYTGGTYTFNFEGTYMGGVQVRAIVDGAVVATGTIYINKQAMVTVPQNTGTQNRNMTFQYKREDSIWMDLPATTNRVQAYNNGGGVVPGDGISYGGYVWAPGNLVRINGVYQFYSNQSQSSYSWSGGDYWNWNTLDPNSYTASMGYWSDANDPCAKVAPAGTWKTPSSAEMQVLLNAPSTWSTLNGKPGRYIGANRELFLQAAGWRINGGTTMSNTGVAALYWTRTAYGTNQAYCLGVQNNNIRLDAYILRNMGASIRCVKR